MPEKRLKFKKNAQNLMIGAEIRGAKILHQNYFEIRGVILKKWHSSYLAFLFKEKFNIFSRKNIHQCEVYRSGGL